MNNTKGIIKSGKSIMREAQVRKNHPHFNSSNKSIQVHSEINSAGEDLKEVSLPKTCEDKNGILVKTDTSRDGKEVTKSRSCMKKEHSCCKEDQEIRSTKSIKFQTNLDKVFVYSIPGVPSKNGKEQVKKVGRSRQKVDQECCYIY